MESSLFITDLLTGHEPFWSAAVLSRSTSAGSDALDAPCILARVQPLRAFAAP